MSQVRFVMLLGFIALVAPGGASLRAHDSGLAYGYLFGYGAMNTPAIRSFVPAPPYFALHPPVYYGQRYTRPYGDSPFASWPQLQPAPGYHPRPAAAHAQILVNPYVPCEAPACEVVSPVTKAQPATSAAPIQALVIENPYYRASDAAQLVTTTDEAVGHTSPTDD